MRYAFLASPLNIPPIIFRFQFNPEILNIKKAFKYDSPQNFGLWTIDKAEAGASPGGFAGGVGAILGALDDIKEWGSLLTKVKPIEAKEGEPQTVSLEFKLDASPSAQTLEGELLPVAERRESLEGAFAALQSFMYPSYDLFDIFKTAAQGRPPCLSRPPECSFIYGNISITGHITDLGIKVTAFDEDGGAVRADVSVTLKEQALSLGTIPATIIRIGRSAEFSFKRSVGFGEIGGSGMDWLQTMNPFR